MEKEWILYHGSKGGINGSIAPISREKCDFGKGFYMGTDKRQTASLVMNDSNPILYTLRVKIPPEAKILKLSDWNWMYAVLASRQAVKEFNELDIAKEWRKQIASSDLVIGSIADDQMYAAMTEFSEGSLTDAGLKYCLSRVSFGNQYAAKTAFMCRNIEILNAVSVSEALFPDLKEYMKSRRQEGINVVREARRLFRRTGNYIDEIIEQELGKKS